MADGESSERPSPYLDTLSGEAAERITAMKWARYLGAAFGPSGAMSALRYYVEIDWISDEVRRAMVDYVRGLTIDELELSDVEPELHGSLQNLEDTAFERHARSLQFVAAISGRSIEHGLASLQLAESAAPGVGGNLGGSVSGGQPPSMGASGGPFLGGAMAPGEQAEMAAGASQRQRDRARRDERGGKPADRGTGSQDTGTTGDGGPESSTATDATPEPTTADDGPGRRRADEDVSKSKGTDRPVDDDAEDVAVSKADLTPDSALEPGGSETPTEDDSPGYDPARRDDDATASHGTAAGSATDDDPLEDWRRRQSEDRSKSDTDEVADLEPTPEPAPSASSTANGYDPSSDGGRDLSDDGSTLQNELEHTVDEHRCVAVLPGGDRCSNAARHGSEYCQQHSPE